MASKKTLVIVESPAKSHTLSRYLDKSYEVLSSMGHVRDLPKAVLGIDVKNGYKPCYVELPEKKKVIEELKKSAPHAARILLASDPDREGEAIAFHLMEILKEYNREIQRILFHEITRSAVTFAVNHPQPIDLNKVESQQMRRLLDRLAGYKISPVLHRKIGGPLSAGRVQSVALKLIVEREREIRSFLPEEYWTVEANLEGSAPPPFTARLEKAGNKALKIGDKETCNRILEELRRHDYVLDQIKQKEKKKKAPPPLITSSLQQEAFRRFTFPVKKTMQIAQQLYEGVDLGGKETTGLITYMRTDSFRISPQAQKEARDFILARFGEPYLPERPNVFRTKAKSQDAHECIRPTFPLHEPEAVRKYLNPTQQKIYQLVWDRFLASQMSDADILETQFHVKNGNYLFLCKGEAVAFNGFLAVLRPERREATSEEGPEAVAGAGILPKLREKEILRLLKTDARQNFTKPPPRYTEATLVKVLEEKGIGRPSTYAKIIETLGKREYVSQEERKFVPSDLGMHVVDYLEEYFTDIMSYDFTADLEKDLDRVSEGKMNWREGIDKFYKDLEADLEKVKKTEKVAVTTGKNCPQCGRELVRKYSFKTKGWFVGCSGYPDCQYTENGQGSEASVLLDKNCPQCGQPLVKRFSRKTRRHFIGCSGFPKCTYIEKQTEDLGPCPLCQRPLTKRFSRKTRRSFVGCTGYPECTYIAKPS